MSGRVPDKAAWREATLAAGDVRRTELLKKSPGILRPRGRRSLHSQEMSNYPTLVGQARCLITQERSTIVI